MRSSLQVCKCIWAEPSYRCLSTGKETTTALGDRWLNVLFTLCAVISLINDRCRSSGPVSYGYSELENNNQVSMTSSTCDMALQTPNVEYSSTSIKKEIVVSL